MKSCLNINYVSVLYKIPKGEQGILTILFFLLPVFFLTIKSWTNTISVLLAILSIYKISKNFRHYFLRRGLFFWTLLLLIATPFLSEIAIQVLRGPFTAKALDGPSRFLLGGVIFIFLSRNNRCLEIFKIFALGCLFSVFITFLSVFFVRDYFWGDRAATYFVDPNSLPVYTGILSCISFFYLEKAIQKNLIKWAIIILIIMSYLYVIHISQTRTSWLPAFLLLTYILTRKTKAPFACCTFIVLGLTLIAFLFYKTNFLFQKRADDIFFAIKHMSNGNFSTSSLSVRVNIMLAELSLIKGSPVLGFPDGAIPSYLTCKEMSPTLDETAYFYLNKAGSHCEILAQLVRKGLFLGATAVFSLFIFPALIFLRGVFFNDKKASEVSRTSVCVVIMLIISSLGIQVFNLKMYSGFWAIFIGLIYSVLSNYENNKLKRKY